MVCSRPIFEWIHSISPLDQMGLGVLAVADFCPFFAYVLARHDFRRTRNTCSADFWKKYQSEQKFIPQYESGDKFKTQNDKWKLFLPNTIKDVQAGCYDYGYGNCGLMADAAFLAAIYQEHNYPITYLRFVCRNNPNVDVLNCMALGAWPNADCIIIAPWADNAVFQWHGTIKETPQIKQTHSLYNQVKVICKISAEEKQRAREQLLAAGYENWPQSPERQSNLDKIPCYAQRFLANMQQTIQLAASDPPQEAAAPNP